VTLLNGCGGGSSSSNSSDRSSEGGKAVLEEATLQGVESGHFDLTLGAQTHEKNGEFSSISAGLNGSFQGEGESELPQLEVSAKSEGSIGGKSVDFEGGLTLLSNGAYINYEGTEYEVDPGTLGLVESMLTEAAGEGEAGSSGCQEEVGKLELADFVEDPVNKGSANVAGEKTTEIAGSLDFLGAIDVAFELADSPACKAQLSAAGPLPSKAEVGRLKKRVDEFLTTPRIVIYVGEDDIVREIAMQLVIYPKGRAGVKKIEIELALELTKLNEEQRITAPQSSEPLSVLFVKLGINPAELLGRLNGEGTGVGGVRGLLEGLGEEAGGGSSAGDGGSQ
jgi:hypothetical protein